MKMTFRRFRAALAFLVATATALSQTVPVPDNLWRLADQEDTDGDRRITVHDRTTPFEIRNLDGSVARTVTNVYPLSVLLQELKRADDRHTGEVTLIQLRLDEPVVDRTHRLIKEFYWDALTRRIDADHLDQVISDPKVASNYDYIYVPGSDPVAAKYFQALEVTGAEHNRSPALKVVVLPPPDKITGAFVRHLDGAHGILSLKLELDPRGQPVRGVPYVVPGGRFNELYYWDSYFIVLGLLQDGRTDLARATADNLLYALEHYGKAPNANRTYYLTRSQPPFLTSILRAVYEAGAADRKWLASALKIALAEYRNVWLGPERLVKIGPHQLSRYWDGGHGPCPEVEPGHYDEMNAPWLAQANSGRLPSGPSPRRSGVGPAGGERRSEPSSPPRCHLRRGCQHRISGLHLTGSVGTRIPGGHTARFFRPGAGENECCGRKSDQPKTP
jgi:alpha,alpha-trehalase